MQECKREVLRLIQTSGKPMAHITRERGVSDTRFHHWRKELGGMDSTLPSKYHRLLYSNPYSNADELQR
jgi:transposase